MKGTQAVLVAFGLCVFAAPDGHAFYQEGRGGLGDSSVPGRVIVKYKGKAPRGALNALHAIHKVKNGRRLFIGSEVKRANRRAQKKNAIPDLSGVYVVSLDSGADVESAIRDFRNNPDVEYAEKDGIVTVQMAPSDTFYGSIGSWGQAYDDLWGLKKIRADSAWNAASGQGIVVAVADTGIDYNHPDLHANLWNNPNETFNNFDDDGNGYADDVYGYNFVSNNGDPMDVFGHGTHVAGIIAATGGNAQGVIGLAYQSKIMALKGLSDGGAGNLSDLANAFYYAANNGADVINISWAGTTHSPAFKDAVDYAIAMGCVVIAAAGNNNEDARLYYPAAYPNVISVAAFDPFDQKASFSNWGDKIDVAAPGVDVLSLRAAGSDMYGDGNHFVGGGYYRASGTSMAAPHVAGLAALILSRRPGSSNEDVLQIIRGSADDVDAPGRDPYSGYGRINAHRAFFNDDDFHSIEAFAYPNPSFNDLTIRVEAGSADSVQIRIYDLSGRRIQQATLTQLSVIDGKYAYEHNVADLGSGVYLFTVQAKKDDRQFISRGKFAVVK